MQEKRKRAKARKRAERLLAEAWEALEEGNEDLAAKLSRRATDEDEVSAAVWNERGAILLRLRRLPEADRALRRALEIEPRHAEAWGNLADLYAMEGKKEKALHFQRKAVELEPDSRTARRRLEALEAEQPEAVVAKLMSVATAAEPAPPTERTRGHDWTVVEEDLVARGAAILDRLLTAEECSHLVSLWSSEACFEHEIDLADDEAGRVRYRFLSPPLPALVQELRNDVYVRLVATANRWQERLGRTRVFPATHEDLLAACRGAGQSRTTPILLHYREGGFNGLHLDVAGDVFFSLQLAVTLGPASARTGGGGAFVLVDVRPGRRQHRREFATGLGDGIVFWTRERPKKIGGVWGIQPVRHGVTTVTGSERFALGIPFHDNA